MKKLKIALVIAAIFILTIAFAGTVSRKDVPADISLGWTASPSVEVDNYNLYYGPSTRNYTNVVATGTNLTITVSNLIRGSIYFFTITANCTTNGLESEYSNEVFYTPKALPAAPTITTITGN